MPLDPNDLKPIEAEDAAKFFFPLSLSPIIQDRYPNNGIIGDKDISYSGLYVNEDLFINKRQLTSKPFVFSNVCFKKLTISDCKFDEISFVRCQFEEKLEFLHCSINELCFEDCEINSGYEFKYTTSTLICDIKFEATKIKENGIVKNCNIHKFNYVKTVHLGVLELYSDTLGEVIFEDSNVDKIEAKAKAKINDITIKNSEIDTLSLSSPVGKLAIETLFLNGRIELNKNDVSDIYIFDLTGPGTLLFNSNGFEQCKLEYLQLEKLEIKECSIKNVFSVTNSSVSIFELNETSILSEKVKFINFKIPDYGSIKWFNSDLGPASFLKCDFESCALEFENTKIQSILLAETDFPKKINFIDSRKPNYEQSQFFFGQLHSTYIKQGDNVRASEYQSRELYSFFKSLPYFEKFYWKRYKKHFWFFHNAFFAKINLGFNYISNNFGRGWAQAIFFTIIFGVIFFEALLVTSDKYYPSFQCDPELFKAFLKFMNPIRHFEAEDLFKNEVGFSSWGYVWDFLGRVFVAYGYYQTISAFRRYGRK